MAEEDDRAKQATSRVVVALRRAAGDGVRPVGRLARHFATLKMNEPNHTIKLRNAGMQFVALRSLEAALHVIKSGWNACATTVLHAPGRRHGGVARQQGHAGAQS